MYELDGPSIQPLAYSDSGKNVISFNSESDHLRTIPNIYRLGS